MLEHRPAWMALRSVRSLAPRGWRNYFAWSAERRGASPSRGSRPRGAPRRRGGAQRSPLVGRVFSGATRRPGRITGPAARPSLRRRSAAVVANTARPPAASGGERGKRGKRWCSGRRQRQMAVAVAAVASCLPPPVRREVCAALTLRGFALGAAPGCLAPRPARSRSAPCPCSCYRAPRSGRETAASRAGSRAAVMCSGCLRVRIRVSA